MLEQISFRRHGAGSPAERQLVLLSAGIAARRRSTHGEAERLAVRVDWSRLAQTLRVRRLLAPLGPRILELVEGHADDGFAVEVEQAIDSARRQGAFLQLVAVRTMAALADAGICSAALKGPILSEAIYGDVGRRWSGDLDLLVSARQLGSAVEVVRTMGYGAPSDHVDRRGLPLLHFSLQHQREMLPRVELHWRVHWYERDFAHQRLLPPAGYPPDRWRPAPVDELAALLLFYARDGFIDLRLATDLSAWWDTFGGELQPGALDELVCRYPALGPALAAATKTAERVVGLPPPARVKSGQRLSLRGRVAVRLANPHPYASYPQLYADASLIDGLLAPPGGLGAFARRQLLQPREVLSQRARQTQSRRGTSRLGNVTRVLIRYGLAMTRLLRAPEGIARDGYPERSPPRPKGLAPD
ncbi:MAG TPA: nucleotidyltransferase family protein [Solirubrobacteraceae bacterium]